MTPIQMVGSGGGGRVFRADRGYGNGSADATDHLQSLLDEAQDVRGVVELPAGTNYVVDGLETADGFDQPSLIADGGRGAVTLTASGAGTILKMNGGSGQISGTRIENVVFAGTGAQGLELSGIGGVQAVNCEFDDGLTGGVLFHNEDAGEFTEFNVLRRCRFGEGVATHIEYRRTAGNDSFHGSGFEDCVFVQDADDTEAKILVGGGCKVYNAPWSGHFFINAEGVPLIEVVDTPPTVYGAMNVETAGNGSWETPIVDPSGEGVFYAGDVLALTPGVILAPSFVQVVRAQYNTDGSLTWIQKPIQARFELTTGTNATVSLPAGIHWVTTRVSAANYEWWFAHVVDVSPFDGTGGVTEIANPWSLNSAGYGEPAFDVVGYTLTITQAGFPASGVTAVVGVTQGASFSNFWIA